MIKFHKGTEKVHEDAQYEVVAGGVLQVTKEDKSVVLYSPSAWEHAVIDRNDYDVAESVR